MRKVDPVTVETKVSEIQQENLQENKKEHRTTKKCHCSTRVWLSMAISCGVTGLSFFLFIWLMPYFEKDFLPSLRLLDTLKKDQISLLNHYTQANEKLQTYEATLGSLSHLKETVAMLKEQLEGLSEKVATLEAASHKPSSALSPGAAIDIQEKITAIQEAYRAGRPFTEIIHALIPFFVKDKPTLEILHQLTVYADTPTKTKEQLLQELTAIYQHLLHNREEMTQLPEEMSFFTRLWIRIRSIIKIKQIRKEELSDTQYASVITPLQRAVKLMQENKFEDAIAEIRPMGHQYTSLLGTFLQEAERRLSLDQLFGSFSKSMDALNTRGAA